MIDTTVHGAKTIADHTMCNGRSRNRQINNSIPIQKMGERIYKYKAMARMDEETFRTKKVKMMTSAINNAVMGSARSVSHALLFVIKEIMYRYPAKAKPSIMINAYMGSCLNSMIGKNTTQKKAHKPMIGMDQRFWLNTR